LSKPVCPVGVKDQLAFNLNRTSTESKFMELAISNQQFQNHLNCDVPRTQRKSLFESDPLLLLNEELENLRLPHEISEPALEGLLTILEGSGTSGKPFYWLMMARIFELALFCAGHYADNCEFSAAGDLLVNPRKVLIHRKGYPHALVKQRHARISGRLHKGGICRKQVLLLLKHEVTVEVATPAILPYLFEQLQLSRKIAAWYLTDAQERMKKVAATIGFLSAWPATGFEDFHRRLQMASPKTYRFVSDHLCRFDTRYFKRLGMEIQKIIENSNDTCEFLVHQ